MKASYLYQCVNVVAGVILLALLLRFFSKDAFLEWSLFTTIGGFTIQLESSLSTVCSRFLVRVHHRGGSRALSVSIAQCKRWYLAFAVLVFLGLCVGGFFYFSTAAKAGFTGSWMLEWMVFSTSYLVTYLFAYNCCVLIASERITTYAIINVTTRLLNVALSSIFILSGLRVLGLCVSLLLSAAVGAFAMRWAGSRAIAAEWRRHPEDSAQGTGEEKLEIDHVGRNIAFIGMAYFLYRAGLLIDAGSSFDASVQASYGLLLQILALIMALSSVPINMLVAPLQRAVLAADPGQIVREMARLAVYANIVFVTALLGLLILGPALSHGISARAALPGALDMAMLGFGFFLELNILLLVNVAIGARSYRFVPLYAVSAAIGVSVAVVLRSQGVDLYLAFGLAPAVTQMVIAVPLIGREVARLTGVTLRSYILGSGAFLRRVLRHPIRVGLAFR
jgi:hypothetical protein